MAHLSSALNNERRRDFSLPAFITSDELQTYYLRDVSKAGLDSDCDPETNLEEKQSIKISGDEKLFRDQGPILLTGSTGDIGSQLRQQLNQAGRSYRLLLRREKQVTDAKAAGVDAVFGDLNQSADDLSKTMHGCSVLVLLTPDVPEQLEQNKNAIDAAVKANVGWIIRISTSDKRDACDIPWSKAHAAADRYLQDQAGKHGLKWTILEPSAFFSNIAAEAPLIRLGLLPQASGYGSTGWVDTLDVAAMCSKILTDGSEQPSGKRYILNGPCLINFYDIAATLSKHIGHRVRYVDLPPPIARMMLRIAGLDAWTADGLVAQFTELRYKHDEGLKRRSTDVQTILGRPPTSFDAYVERNIDLFRGRNALPRVQLASALLLLLAVLAVLGSSYRWLWSE